nr:Nif11-like leader peptide family RiPP precursor [Synergistaceae bacterium]
MSLASAEKFYEDLENDPKLTEHIRELQNPETISHYTRNELGYEFTREEMQKVIFERNPELSDGELEAVVGGEDALHLVTIGLGGVAVGVGAAAAAA